MTSTAGAMAGVSSCGHIIQLLMTAKANKEEFRSLLVAVQGIYSFLHDLPEDGITPQGTAVLREWQDASVTQGWAVELAAVGVAAAGHSIPDLPAPTAPLSAEFLHPGSPFQYISCSSTCMKHTIFTGSDGATYCPHLTPDIRFVDMGFAA